VKLKQELKLIKIIVPLLVKSETGINDDLDGKKKPVTFEIENEGNPVKAEVIQASSKWKRMALKDYGFEIDVCH
jgi:aspartate--ammonia ligase